MGCKDQPPDMSTMIEIPTLARYTLAGAKVPRSLVAGPVTGAHADAEDCLALDIRIDGGRVAALWPAGTAPDAGGRVDLGGRQVWPTFVDMHAHLDKGHVIPRIRPDGTIHGGFALTVADWPRWTSQDIALRMEFGLKCAYAHGVSAIRTHLDSVTLAQSQTAFGVFSTMRADWADRVDLQGVAITPMDSYLTDLGPQLADLAAAHGGVLGGVTDTLERGENGTYERLDQALDAMFALARDRGLDVDLHVDQTDDLGAFTIPNIARARIRSGFQGRVVCDHCVNLSLQPDHVIAETLALARDADLGFVSMPTPMMYLMDRKPGRTPRWRGVTAAKEIMAAGLPLAVGGDNCRDAWFAYGDHDMLDTLKQAIRVFQTDEPLTGSPDMATRTPADLIGRPDLGRIGVGLAAKMVIFSARSLNTLMCRDQADRIVLNNGVRVTDPLPLHEDLALALGIDSSV
jgi:cytosine deaminase